MMGILSFAWLWVTTHAYEILVGGILLWSLLTMGAGAWFWYQVSLLKHDDWKKWP